MEFCPPIAVFACTCSPLLPAAMPIRLAPYFVAAVRACAGSLAIGGQSGMQVRAAVQPGAMNCKRCRQHSNTPHTDGHRQALLSCRQCKLPMQGSSANALAAKRRQCNALGQQAVARSVKMHRILLPLNCNARLRTTIRTIEAADCRSPPAWVSLPPTTGATFGLLFLQMS